MRVTFHGRTTLITSNRTDFLNASPPLSAQEHAAGFTNRKRTIALVVVALAFVMDLLDSTITNIAIPSIRLNLHASYASIQWVVAGYALTFAILLVTGGRMGDVFGYKKLFLAGITGFTIASLLSGLAINPAMLIASRLLQGSMAALMVPQVMSLMQVMYKPTERGAINGLFGALGGLSASLGPIVGGLLIKADIFGLDWRPIFLINVPIGIFGVLAAIKYLPDGKSSHPLKLDIFGTFLVMTAMLLLVFPLIQGRDLGWPAWTFLMIIASVPVFGAFAWWQKHKMDTDGSPLVLPILFKNISFTVGLAINLVFEMAMIGFFLTFGLLLQIGYGFSPIHAALTGLPTAFGIALTMAIGGQKLIPKLGRYSLTFGTVVMAIGLGVSTLVLGHYTTSVHTWQLIPGLLIVGVGMGLVFGALFSVVLNGVDPRNAGSASGTLNAVQQVGGAIGVAVIGVIFFGQLSAAAPASFVRAQPALAGTLTALKAPAQAIPIIDLAVENCFVDRSQEKDSSVVPPSCNELSSASRNTSPKLKSAIVATTTHANGINFANAFSWSMVYALMLLFVTFCLTWLLPKNPAVSKS
jgi:EmrB/QacA subfamily drug resistance transporter